MKVWLEGPDTLSGVGEIRVFSTPHNVVEFWKRSKCRFRDSTEEEQLERGLMGGPMSCMSPMPFGGMECRTAKAEEIDGFYLSGN